jgi:hypothetical protein
MEKPVDGCSTEPGPVAVCKIITWDRKLQPMKSGEMAWLSHRFSVSPPVPHSKTVAEGKNWL